MFMKDLLVHARYIFSINDLYFHDDVYFQIPSWKSMCLLMSE